MKKLFTLTVVLVAIALSATAQNHRKWDFTNWSAKTIDNLTAEAAKGVTGGSWSDTEKADGSNNTGGNCFWSYADANVGSDGLMANGELIAETEGLVFNTAYVNRRSLAIAVNYPSTSLGEYAGPAYLWLGGGNAKSASARILCFTIPKVAVGQKITIVAESHKPSDARGVSLFVGSVTDDANQIGESFKPKTQESYTWEGWTLPTGATANDDGTVDILVYNTNGCHIYSIEVGEAAENTKILYLYTGDQAAEGALATLQGMANVDITATDVASTTITAEELQQYSVTVISPSVPAANAAVAVVKEALPFTPIVNLNNALYPAWGYGEAVVAAEGIGVVNNAGSKLLSGVSVENVEGVNIVALSEGSLPAVKLGEYFKDDDVVLTSYVEAGEGDVLAHVHNATHNGYVYLPWSDGSAALLSNAVNMMTNSKAAVTAAGKPTISFEYKNMETIVTISSTAPKAEIFYTTDGTEPDAGSTPYTEPFAITEAGVTVKAVARGEGFLLSEAASEAVVLKQQVTTPQIAVTQVGNTAVVELSCETPDVYIYYNYEASNDSLKSTRYLKPITLMTDKAISVFAVGGSYAPSEVATQQVTVAQPLKFGETLASMDANKAEYYDAPIAASAVGASDSKVAYFFTWGKTKTAYPYYDTTAEPVSTTTDPETGDVVNVYPKSAEQTYDFQNGWGVRSRGQIVCTEITIKPAALTVGTHDGLGVSSSYAAATVDEAEFADTYPCTDFYVNLSEWNTADPKSAMIYTTKKVKGPFAVITYISNGNASTGPTLVLETGQDIAGDATETEWQQFGEPLVCDQGQRLYRKYVRIYEGTDEVYLRLRDAEKGSKAGVYNIYVVSLEGSNIITTGITDVADKAQQGVRSAAIYTLSGQRVDAPRRGIYIQNGRKVVIK